MSVPRPFRSPLGVVCRLVVLLALALPAPGALPPGREALTTAAEVRALSVEEATQAVPVRLRGVFMGEADPEGIAFVLQDDTEAIYIQGPAPEVAAVGRGDLLEVVGVSDPGGFAPYVIAHHLRRIGHVPVPEPARVTLDELYAGAMDAKWVEFTGIVRSIEPRLPTDIAPPSPRHPAEAAAVPAAPNAKVKLLLAAGNTRVTVEVDDELEPAAYVDARVRVRGLCLNLHNRNRQFVRPFVQVPRGVELIVERPPPEKPFAVEPTPIGSLLRFEQLAGRRGHRVHVRGVVVHQRPGVAIWVRDGDSSLRVETTQPEPLQPGDEVDVLGFPALGEYSAVLENAVFRQLPGRRAQPEPRVLTDVSSALRNDADLVQLEARLVAVRRSVDGVMLTLDWRRMLVAAQVLLPENAPPPKDWLPGSRVRVAGVCSVITDDAGPLGGLWEPTSFQLLLRTPADLAVVAAPPWWNADRVVWVLSGFLVASMGTAGAVMLVSRRRLQDQEHRRAMAETEFAAILSERNRMAREIHDTLSQSLGAISVQLELARAHASEFSVAARNHLATAHRLARAALAEARESIWDMRSQVLERCDLGEALEGILVRLTEGTEIVARVQVEGDRRRLPPVVENNLLRIGQEAITNASTHACPRHITVTLSFEGRQVRLVVEDDGVGFAPGAETAAGRRRFGLVGMRERADLLGGKADIASAPGQGTRVTVLVSV